MLIEDALNSSELAFPALECLHILGFAFSVGTVAIVNFRLIGIGMTNQTGRSRRGTSSSPAQLWKDTFWTLVGPLVVVFSGLLLFSSDPDNYYLNYPFLLKMLFLMLAIAYNYTIIRKTALAAYLPRNSKTALDCTGAVGVCCVRGNLYRIREFDFGLQSHLTMLCRLFNGSKRRSSSLTCVGPLILIRSCCRCIWLSFSFSAGWS